MMDPLNGANKFEPAMTPAPVGKLNLQDKRVNELLGSEPYATYPNRLNTESTGTQEDGSSIELTGAVSSSSSPLQDVARFALRAMEEKSRMNGPELAPAFGSGRKTSAKRAYGGKSPFKSLDDDSFMVPEDLANGAGFSSSFCTPNMREIGAVDPSLANERHAGQHGMFSQPIPVKRKRGRPAKTDLPGLDQSQTRPKKKKRVGADGPNSSTFTDSPGQASVIEVSEGSSRPKLVKGRNKRVSVLKPISENAPKRRGRPPKNHLTAPSSQSVTGDAIPNSDGHSLQNALDNAAVPGTQESLESGFPITSHDKIRESKGFAISEKGAQANNPTGTKGIIGKPVKKRGPGRPRKTETIIQSIEDNPEKLTVENGVQTTLLVMTKKSKPRETKSLQPSFKSELTSGTPRIDVPENRGSQPLKGFSVDELSTQRPKTAEPTWKGGPDRLRNGSLPAYFQATAPPTALQTWNGGLAEEATERVSKDWDISSPKSQPPMESQYEERNIDHGVVTTATVKKRRGRPPRSKLVDAAAL